MLSLKLILVTTFFSFPCLLLPLHFLANIQSTHTRYRTVLKGDDAFNFRGLNVNTKHSFSGRHHHFDRNTFIIALFGGFLERGMKWKELFYLAFFSGRNDKLKNI